MAVRPDPEQIPERDEAVNVPSDLNAEQAIIGAWLTDTKDHARYLECPVGADLFFFSEHVDIVRVISDYVLQGKATDAILVAAELRKRGTLESVGGIAYLRTLCTLVPPTGNLPYYAENIREAAIKRKILQTARRTYERAFTPNVTGAELQSELAQALDSIDQPADVTMAQVVVNSIADQTDEKKSSEHWPKCGIQVLDYHLGGFKPGAVTCIAAFPGIGKSSIAGYAIYTVAKRMIPDCYISLEMNQQELYNRCMAIEGVAPNYVMNQHHMTPLQLHDYARVGMEIAAPLPMWLVDKKGNNADEILTEIRRQRVIHGVQLFVLDYLQLVQPTGGGQGNYNQFLSWFTAQLKNAARTLDCHIIEISQVSRDAFKNDRPLTMHDLRDSGSIEQNADNIILLNKIESSMTPGNPTCIVSVEIAKQRSGINGVSFALSFNQDFQQWSSPLDGTPTPELPAKRGARRVRKPDETSGSEVGFN